MNFIEALTTLESLNCRVQDKEKAYNVVLSDFKSDATHLGDESLKLHSQRLLKLLCRDVVLTSEKIVDICLQILQQCLSVSYFRSSQSADSVQLLQALILCAQKAQSVDILKRVLVCLSSQDFTSAVVTTQITSMVDMVEAVNAKAKSQSSTVLEETVNLFVRLEEQIPERLKPQSKRWARYVLPGLAASSEVVREKSFNLLVKFKGELQEAPDLSKHLIKAINSGLARSLKCFMAKHEMYAMKTWALVIEICGKEFHKGPSINAMLEIIEIGFKSCPEAKCQAFVSWRSLVSNFGLDKGVISDPKRVKLLMMVFRYDNAKTEPVAVEKMLTWWHFVLNICPKLNANFEKIIYPMIQFCVGSSKAPTSQPSRIALKPSTPNLQTGLMSPQGRSVGDSPAFPAVQKLGVEAISLLLCKPSAVERELEPKISWNLKHLPDEVFGSSAFFAKHSIFLMNSLHQIFKDLTTELNESLVLHAWTSLAGHIKASLEGSNKTEMREVFSTFLTNLHCMVEERVFSGETLFKMTEACSSFPLKVLASTAYNISGTVRGCPALLLSEILLTPTLMETSCSKDKYFKLFSFFVSAGASNVQGALMFLQTVSEALESNSMSLASAELLWKMWNTIAQTLQETIIASNEVNQGDALEYNFGCMYSVLLLPVKQQLASRISQNVSKTMTKHWKELYHSFARLSALVATAEANACLEETCGKILHKWKPEFKEPANLEFLVSILQKMLDCVDFSAFSNTHNSGSVLTLSPGKWARRRQRPLGNLNSFIHLADTIQKNLNSWVFSEGSKGDMQNKNGALVLAAHTLVEIHMRLFMHVNTPSLISQSLAVLAESMSRLFKNSSHCNLQRLFVPSFFTKLEKLWHEIALCVGGRYSEPYTSELLAWMSPLFEVTFLHSRRTIKNQALALWNTTFSRALSLEYPAELKPVLTKVKEKTPIVLPGWITADDLAVIAESPFSEMSMGGDSQVIAPPVLATVPSPKRPRASMLNKDLSPARKAHLSPPPATAKASPVKVMTPKEARKLFAPAGPSRNLVDMMPEEEFVVISSPATKKKRLLTEHQKEVLKEKSVLPAMYNNLDASQDVSLMSQFATDTQTETVSTQDVIVISPVNSQEQLDTNKTTMQPPKGCEKIPPIRSSKRISERVQVENEKTESNDSGASMSSTKASSLNKPVASEGDALNPSHTKADKSFNKSVDKSLQPAVELDSPFVMFRQGTSTSSPISLSQDADTNRSKNVPRRVSLRKSQSENSMFSCDNGEGASTKEKEPRRVPLKRLDSPKTKGKSDRESTGLGDILSNWSAQLEKSKNALKENGEVDVNDEEEIAVSGVAAAASAYTLVEDTQSPEKVKKRNTRQTGESITETPTKSDDSLSPHLRTSSARKLFDDEPKPSTDKQQETPTRPAVVFPGSDDAISSSQGFEPRKETTSKAEDHHTMFGFSQLVDEPASKSEPAQDKDGSQEGSVVVINESESVIPRTQESESFLRTTMPTLASPSKIAQVSLSGSKSGSSLTNSSTLSTLSDVTPKKSSPSPEVDFFPVQSTLQEDSLKEVVNKRKKTTPKKYSPEKPKRRARRQLKEQAQQAAANEEKERSNSLTLSKTVTDKEEEIVKKCTLLVKSIMDGKKEPSKGCPSIDSKEDTNKTCSTLKKSNSEGKEGTGKKCLDGSLGEVTPDMKSPSNSTPQRGHSSTKRKRRLEQEGSKNPKARKSISPEVDKDDNEGSSLPKLILKGKSPERLRLRRGSKRKGLHGSSRSRSPRSRHMLRTRNKSGNSVSPPARKARKLYSNEGEANKSFEGEDVQKSSTEKDDNVPESVNMESDSDDDTPLASLKSQFSDDDDTPLASLKTNPSNPLGSVTDELDQPMKYPTADITNSAAPEEIAAVVRDEKEAETSSVKAVASAKPVSKSSSEAPSKPLNINRESEQPSRYEIIDKALSTVLSKISQEVQSKSPPKIDPSTSSHAQEEFTPLLLSEDVNQDVNQSANQGTNQGASILSEDSPDHLQAGQSVVSSPGNDDSSTAEHTPAEQEKPCGNTTEASICDAGGESESGAGDSVQSARSNREEEDMDAIEVDPAAETECVGDKDAGRPEGDIAEKLPEEKSSEPVGATEAVVAADDGEINSSEAEKLLAQRAVVLHDWSPSKSPSFSILKKTGSPSPRTNRVSFAEPVVNGESPVREKYHSESLPTSPLIIKSDSQKKGSPLVRSMGRISGYRRRLNQCGKQQDLKLSRIMRVSGNLPSSPVKPQSPLQYKATQESQLDSTNPIFPDLVGCDKPVDDILPQLTSSLWYRGLHHLMKGRKVNTIGDLSALTEVQVNQLPIRHPKMETVRMTLKAYMAQHGLFKPVIRLGASDVSSPPPSKGATIGQAVTPSSIADEGIQIRSDSELDRLSPIEAISDADLQAGLISSDSQEGSSEEKSSNSTACVSSSHKPSSQPSGQKNPAETRPGILATLTSLVDDREGSGLSKLSTSELFDVHQKLNVLFGKVVEEMQARQPQGS